MPTQTQTRDAQNLDPDDTWICAGCEIPVSWPSAAIGVDGGSIEQTFANPSGFVFAVVTVRRTCNLRTEGPESGDFSWFPGRTWRVVSCSGCGRHLGWRFTRGSDRFWALLRTRIL